MKAEERSRRMGGEKKNYSIEEVYEREMRKL